MSSAVMQTMQMMQIQCSNPECRHPNRGDERQCEKCQTPLVRQYLWVVGATAEDAPVGAIVGGRYAVVSSRIWLDTQPAQLPDSSLELPDAALPYLHLYTDRLHLPGLYDLYSQKQDVPPILLLENAPISSDGVLLPAVESLWSSVSPVRQLYWFWQMLDLWQPLQRQGVTRSLLVAENLRVEGWRIRLRELIADEIAVAVTEAPGIDPELEAPNLEAPVNSSVHAPTLADLGQFWQSWVEIAQPEVRESLQALCQEMQTFTNPELQDVEPIAYQLNTLLLEQAAQLPLKLTIAGSTTTGPQRTHNEDTCYPDQFQLPTNDGLMPYVAIVCDGVGGHEGGEVASQLAVRSLKSLLQAFFAEIAEETEVLSPAVIAEQLTGVVRVVNNQIAAQNDAQGRSMRQRMGTTLVMALQVPQKVSQTLPTGSNSHELYIVHVGDSRAYLFNSQSCLRLTVDDDVAVREVRLGRSLYREARQRSDAAALIQALGTRDADTLQITVQRLIVEEDSLLLLCSDGLSDYQRVEQSWEAISREVMRGKLTLESAVEQWITIANEQNGHDNASIVLMHCQINPTIQLYEPRPAIDSQSVALPEITPETDLAESSRALLYDEYAPPSPPTQIDPPRPWLVAIGLIATLLTAGAIGLGIWRVADPAGFQQTIDQVLPGDRE
ncbi:protein phosphatase 2C domain-containing protein [Leptolyngbya ohadii]|uniref:protein phosphatase 2C domain-containing protein n=1 Tax=Leptolyngbya ohadii TaxID=1962290 RepID=UPI000B59D732|nr:protein phosphatase 2C domain-containing protein [Leptolyngbya ohadii]